MKGQEPQFLTNVDLSAFPDPAEFLDLDALQIESEREFVKLWQAFINRPLRDLLLFRGDPPR
jgi:hypothetical protein